jgi:hypothetical protein
MTQRHEQPVADEQLSVNIAEYARLRVGSASMAACAQMGQFCMLAGWRRTVPATVGGLRHRPSGSGLTRPRPGLRIGDFTQGGQCVPGLPGPGQVSRPGGRSVTDDRDSDLDELVPFGRRCDQAGARVAGVGEAPEIARPLDLIDDGTGRCRVV